MKFTSTLFLLLIAQTIFGQIPEKEQLLEGYTVGRQAFEAVQRGDLEVIGSLFTDTTSLAFLVDGFASNRFHADSIKIGREILYNQEADRYEFVVYGGNLIPSTDDWGLFDYHFVIRIYLDLNKERGNQIVETEVMKGDDSARLKNWWRSYMMTYDDPKYTKKEIAEKYGLIPPPPPPPEEKAWFEF